jgi:hypothetical protein
MSRAGVVESKKKKIATTDKNEDEDLHKTSL